MMTAELSGHLETRKRGTLALTRKSGQSFRLHLPHGDTVVVSAVRIGKGRVRFNIDAPKDVIVKRSELEESAA